MKRFLIFLILCSSVIFGEEYQIQFNKSFVKGQKFKIEVKANLEMENKILLDGKAVTDKNAKALLEGIAAIEILEVDDKGAAVKFKMLIESLKADNLEVLPAKTEVFAELGKDDSTVYTVNNVAVSVEVSKYLEKIFNIKSKNRPTDQETFGSSKPVKVGDEWEVNKEAIKKGLTNKQFKITENLAIKGKCKLNKVEKVNGVDQLSVSCDMNFSGVEIPMPAKMNYEKAEVTMKFNGVFPNGTNKNRIEETEEFNFEIKGSGEGTRNNNAYKLGINVKMHDRIERKYIY